MSLASKLVHFTRDNALLTTKEASVAIGVTSWWVRQLIATGELRAINVGGAEKSAQWRIDPEDLSAFIRSRENRARDTMAG